MFKGIIFLFVGVIIIAWIGYNFLIETQPEAVDGSLWGALILSSFSIFYGIKSLRCHEDKPSCSVSSYRKKSLPVRQKESRGYEIEILQHGRYGEILYSENGKKAKLHWEFGGTVLVVIDIPSESNWKIEQEFSITRRKEIAERIAKEVIRQKAPGKSFVWRGNMIHIL
jgi:hypothetical protein